MAVGARSRLVEARSRRAGTRADGLEPGHEEPDRDRPRACRRSGRSRWRSSGSRAPGLSAYLVAAARGPAELRRPRPASTAGVYVTPRRRSCGCGPSWPRAGLPLASHRLRSGSPSEGRGRTTACCSPRWWPLRRGGRGLRAAPPSATRSPTCSRRLEPDEIEPAVGLPDRRAPPGPHRGRLAHPRRPPSSRPAAEPIADHRRGRRGAHRAGRHRRAGLGGAASRSCWATLLGRATADEAAFLSSCSAASCARARWPGS